MWTKLFQRKKKDYSYIQSIRRKWKQRTEIVESIRDFPSSTAEIRSFGIFPAARCTRPRTASTGARASTSGRVRTERFRRELKETNLKLNSNKQNLNWTKTYKSCLERVRMSNLTFSKIAKKNHFFKIILTNTYVRLLHQKSFLKT